MQTRIGTASRFFTQVVPLVVVHETNPLNLLSKKTPLTSL
jgi:hypothetical protein